MRRLLFEGGQINKGAWPISWFRIAKGWGMLPHNCWPDHFDEEGAPTIHEPPNADDIAKNWRVLHYQRLRSELECFYAATSSRMTSVALEITKAWRDPLDGLIPVDGGNLPVQGIHSIGIVDFDFTLKAFVFPNTWGDKWGKRGIGFLPFGYLDRYLVEAWTAPATRYGSQYYKPGIDLRLSKGEESKLGTPWILDVVDGTNDIIVGWAHLVQTQSSLDVEELFVRPDYRGRGFGANLVHEIQKVARKTLPARYWVPWGDDCPPNSPRLLGWAKKLGLELQPSGERWAAYMATEGTPVDLLPALSWIPSRATSPLTLLADPEDATSAGTNTEQWSDDNAWNDEKATRRAKLVEKKYESSLTLEEEMEFELLQQAFGEHQDDVSPLPQG